MPELIPAEPLTPEWHAARRQGVTATDIVTILGLSSWDSAYSLYWRKLGQVPDKPERDRLELGKALEPYILDRWGRAHENDLVMAGGLYRHSERLWQMATLDARVSGSAVLEFKSWADADKRRWEDGPPVMIRAQVLWQMDVMDVPVGHVGVAFLPSGEFRSYVIEHDEHCLGTEPHDCCEVCIDLTLMRERGAEFYARLQGELPPPDIDASAASLAAVKARFGDARKDKVAPVPNELWNPYVGASFEIDRWTGIKREHENKLRELAGEAGAWEVDGQLVARRLVYDAQVKAHTRHVDSIRHVKQQGDDSE